MKKLIILPFMLFLQTAIFEVANAQDEQLQKVQRLMDSTLLIEGDIFAPEKYLKAAKKFQEAKIAIDNNRKAKTIEEKLAEAEEYAENVIELAAVNKSALTEYLEPREKAKKADAKMHVPELYKKAEDQFVKATKKVESGDVKGGLKEAAKATPLFDMAELEAIRVQVMGKADMLIKKAIEDEAEKYAPSTLDKAKTARAKCDTILTKNRYDDDESVKEIMRAEYEARHATNFAQKVRSQERNDQAWEKLMHGYELEMSRVGKEIGAGDLPFDNGAGAAADSLIYFIQNLQGSAQDSDQLNRVLAEKLKEMLGKLDADKTGSDPVILADRLDAALTDMLDEQKQMKQEISAERDRLAQLQADHETVSAELEQRTALENKFKKAKTILNPSEGEILFNASNDIVLRLTGLSFDINKSNIKDEHIPLLEKAKTVIDMFPESKLVVEGHTDASGDLAANRQLSEKRAFEVMQYLRTSMLISADRISAYGYGAEKPVGSNQTAEGRAKNRRIDIIIMQ